jgi:hypothetical protein
MLKLFIITTIALSSILVECQNNDLSLATTCKGINSNCTATTLCCSGSCLNGKYCRLPGEKCCGLHGQYCQTALGCCGDNLKCSYYRQFGNICI